MRRNRKQKGNALAARFARALHENRKAARVTQESLARMAGVDARTVRNWEKGCTAPSPPMLRRVCNLVGIDPMEVIPMDSRLSFSQSLRVARIACGLTQADMAFVLGVSRETIRRWERGKTPSKRKMAWVASQLRRIVAAG